MRRAGVISFRCRAQLHELCDGVVRWTVQPESYGQCPCDCECHAPESQEG